MPESDIPIGSPPAPPGRHAAPSGWYADPVDPAQERYWDGWQWSRNTRPRELPPGYAAPQASSPEQSSPGPYAPGPGPYGTPGQYGPPGQQYESPGPYGAPGPYGPPAPYSGSPPGPYQNQYASYQQPAPGGKVAYTADGVPLAGWWRRAAALLIDNVILGTVAAMVLFPLLTDMTAQVQALLDQAMRGVPVSPEAINQLMTPREQMIVVTVELLLGAAYHIGFLAWKSATLGKLALGLRIVEVDRGWSPRLPMRSVLIRVALCLLPSVQGFLLIFRALDVLFPLWQPKRQALHDLAARTQVVQRRTAGR